MTAWLDEIEARLAAAPAVERKMTSADMGGAHAYMLSIGRGPRSAVQLPRSAEWARFAEMATAAPADLRRPLAVARAAGRLCEIAERIRRDRGRGPEPHLDSLSMEAAALRAALAGSRDDG